MTWLLLAAAVLVARWLVGSRGTGTGATGTGGPRTGGTPPGQPVGAPPTGAHAVGVAGSAAPPTEPLREQVLRRATDPDDPDGAFMDGYVAGRLTERWRHAPTPSRPVSHPHPPDRADAHLGVDDHDDDDHDDHGHAFDDSYGHDGGDPWADPFDDDSGDDW